MGTKLISALLCSVIIFSSSPTYANLMKLYDIQGSIDTSYDNLTEAELWMGAYDYIGLARIPKTSFNTIVDPDGYGAGILISLLNRTYVPFFTSYGSPWGDASAMLVYNFFSWQLMHLGTLNQESHNITFNPGDGSYGRLYDLSGYDIESLYISSSFIEVGNSTAFEFDLLAEVEPIPPEVQPIPEPSTMTMFGAGLVALMAFRRKRV